MNVVLSLGSVPANVIVCAPVLATENGMLTMLKLVLAGDTRLPTLRAIDSNFHRLHVWRDAAGPPGDLERQRIAAGTQRDRLGDAAGALNECRLRAARCGRSAPGTVVTLDATATGEGPADRAPLGLY